MDTVINLTSQPTMPLSTGLNKGSWTFTNGRLQSNGISHNGLTSGYIVFNAAVGTVKATIGVSSESNYDFMSLHVSTSPAVPSRNNGNMANISGTTTGTYSYKITTAGIYYLHFVYAKDGTNSSGSDCGWLTNVTLPINTNETLVFLESNPILPSGATLNRGSWTYTSNGLQSNSISHNELTSGYIKFNAKVGTVKANIGVSSESGYDYMSLHVSQSATAPSRNGGNMANISGSTTGTYNYNITSAGTYYLHFVYAKDGSGSHNSDCGWIKYASLPIVSSGTVYTNVNGVWKQGVKYVNVNGVWKQASAIYTNVNGVWKQSV